VTALWLPIPETDMYDSMMIRMLCIRD
jgi:hypothetical protein